MSLSNHPASGVDESRANVPMRCVNDECKWKLWGCCGNVSLDATYHLVQPCCVVDYQATVQRTLPDNSSYDCSQCWALLVPADDCPCHWCKNYAALPIHSLVQQFLKCWDFVALPFVAFPTSAPWYQKHIWSKYKAESGKSCKNPLKLDWDHLTHLERTLPCTKCSDMHCHQILQTLACCHPAWSNHFLTGCATCLPQMQDNQMMNLHT